MKVLKSQTNPFNEEKLGFLVEERKAFNLLPDRKVINIKGKTLVVSKTEDTELDNFLSDPEDIITFEESVYIAKEIFGEEYVCMNSDSIFIYFPELIIHNYAKNTSVKIFDLIICLEKGSSVNIFGSRISMSQAESNAGYYHPHLRSASLITNQKDLFNRGNYNLFCTGTSLFNSQRSTVLFDSKRYSWELFYNTLNRFVREESQEGTPYKYMENIQFERDSNISDYAKIINPEEFKTRLEKSFYIGEDLSLEYIPKFSNINKNTIIEDKIIETVHGTLKFNNLKIDSCRYKSSNQGFNMNAIKENIHNILYNNYNNLLESTYLEIYERYKNERN
jgi:hypothetical protein